MEEQKQKSDYLLPASIVIAALIISVSLVYNAGKKVAPADNLGATLGGNQGAVPTAPLEENIKPVGSDDHIFGNPSAPVKVVAFSDLECPFCKSFHPTIKKIVADYNGKVALVYRHFPLDELHPKARKEAVATECAAELGGPPGSEASNQAFWLYVDKVFEITPSNNGLDPALLPKIAQDIGLNRSQFESCLNSAKFDSKINASVKDAMDSGARGTPYSVVISKDNKKYIIPGALDYEQIKPIIDQAL